VLECLYGHDGQAQGLIDVHYHRLEKGTFVRFQVRAMRQPSSPPLILLACACPDAFAAACWVQPLTRGFHEFVDDVRQALEGGWQSARQACLIRP
jgi:hypothetical protein